MEELVIDIFKELARLVERDQVLLLTRWRAQVRQLPSARGLDVPTLNDHIPGLLQELVSALRSGSEETIPEALLDGSPPTHGLQRVKDAFDVEEVVAEYNILRGCIHDLADQNGLSLQGRPFHVLNRVLDEAIGLAVNAFATQKAFEVQQRREEYLAFVAHDLRNPLNAISLSALALEASLAPSGGYGQRAATLLRTLKRNVRALDALVGKVIEENTNVRTEAGIDVVRREFDLWPLVEALFQNLQPVAEASRTRLTNAVPDDFVVYADANLIRRVFQNLIANAIAYTPRGEVVVDARDATADGVVECSVRDDGQGIPADRIHAVFDKYETDPGKDGEGLGLAIVKSFVEAHGGTATVESEPGAGATFRFTLPPRPR
ncbi:MAG: HAMP domain-containing sensor histidine kinase [Acidobacteriota bacterium]